MSNLSRGQTPFGGFPFGISTGQIGGFATKSCAGINSALDTSNGERLVWDINEDYVLPSSGVTFYAVSSSASDTDISILIEYLDSEYTFIREVVSLNGQTPVLFNNDGFRVNEFSVVNQSGSQGDIYITRTNDTTNGVPNVLSDIVSFASQQHQRSLQCIFTTPKDRFLILNEITVSTEKLKSAKFYLKVSIANLLAPVTSTAVEVYQSTHTIDLFARPIPPKADIFVAAETDDNNVSITTRIQYLLANKDIIKQIIL